MRPENHLFHKIGATRESLGNLSRMILCAILVTLALSPGSRASPRIEPMET